jgi:hypothetical protein
LQDQTESRRPWLLEALAAEAAAHPYERKLLVCRRTGIGREILRSLSAAGVPWINFEVSTPVRLAHTLVASRLEGAGLRVADEFDELTHLDAAIDVVLGTAPGRLGELAQSVGLRQAIARSVQALRLAGVEVDELAATRFRDEEKRLHIAAILQDYSGRLQHEGLIDAAGLLTLATAALDTVTAAPGAAAGAGAGTRLDGGGADTVRGLRGRILIAPDLPLRGRTGELVNALLRTGAVLLPTDPVHGLAPPASSPVPAAPATAGQGTALSWLHDVGGWAGGATNGAGDVVLDVFAASSVSAELREVLRRVMAAGLQWDEVEIVTTDPRAYGVALDGLARRLGVPVSYAVGLPVGRTRPGRAAAAYLEWLQSGLAADGLRRMLERGDLSHPAISGPALARRLRQLRVGRGVDRVSTRIQQRLQALDLPADPEEETSSDEREAARVRERYEFTALAEVLQPLFDALPRDLASVSAAELASGVLSLIRPMPLSDAADRTAQRRMAERLGRIAATLQRPTTLNAAAAVLLSRLEDRVPSPEADGTSPWTASGGHLHLSDLDSGGHACRKATFIVGLDAGRFPGFTSGDALLVDEDRRRLSGGGRPRLATSLERLEERRYAFAALVARLRGRVTFSYATWDAAESRSVAPASELLQAYRLMSGNVNADYEALHAAVAPAASAVPRGTSLLDGADTWLRALAVPDASVPERRALRRGVQAVCAVYPNLAAGVRGFRARYGGRAAGPHHGVIAPRPALDPRSAQPPATVSATALQTLGTCPHRYMLRYVLGVRPPDDPQPAADEWLRPDERGSLLHAVFEETLRSAASAGTACDDVAFTTLALDTLTRRAAALRELVPPPGAAVHDAELAALRQDILAFVSMVRSDAPRHIALERVFGRDGEAPAEIGLPDGSVLHLSGAIDRVDQLDDGTLVIVDYKTGSTQPFEGRKGAFAGGRRLQHVLYSAAAERLYGRQVVRAEFHFPTRRSENHRVRYDQRAMAGGLAVVAELLSMVRNGWFVPTNDADDCRSCDYAPACRATTESYGRVDSPLAQWARNVDDHVMSVLRRLR